jgi:hypothetical protein
MRLIQRESRGKPEADGTIPDFQELTRRPQGGVMVSHQYRKDSINQTGSYFSDYIWLRPDGADVSILVAASPAQFPWTSAQAGAVFALPAWDQAVTQVKAYIAAEGSGATGG